MPIRKDLRKFYGEEWKEKVRKRIMKRAYNCCEKCGKKDGSEVLVVDGRNNQFWIRLPAGKLWQDAWGSFLSGPPTLPGQPPREGREVGIAMPRKVTVSISIAHLNHVSGDDRDENLKAFCQYCHLDYDKEWHAFNRCERKDGERPLLAMVAGGEPIEIEPGIHIVPRRDIGMAS